MSCIDEFDADSLKDAIACSSSTRMKVMIPTALVIVGLIIFIWLFMPFCTLTKTITTGLFIGAGYLIYKYGVPMAVESKYNEAQIIKERLIDDGMDKDKVDSRARDEYETREKMERMQRELMSRRRSRSSGFSRTSVF
jgi:hypothetical protein